MRNSKINKKVVSLFLIIAVIAIIGAAIYFFTPAKELIVAKEEVNALTIYHWWTSPGESAAINALIKVFTGKYPSTAVMPTSVVGGSGGGGVALFSLIESLASRGEAPDAFQMHAGYEAKQYFDAGYLEQIDNVWNSGELKNVVPSLVQDMCKFEGHYYAVPVNIHRNNVVWYNKHLLDANNINPTTLTTWDAFFNACDKLKAAGMTYPIQMDGAWTVELVFEGILASKGLDFYQDFINGKITSADNPKLLESFSTLQKYLTYVNPDNANVGWDEATRRVIRGEGAFNIMGDWNEGEFRAANVTFGVDYGTFPDPGTNGLYSLCVDTFQSPKGETHPTNANRWLIVVGSKEGQDAFNPIKGSISARTDANVTKYDAYQQSAMSDFWRASHMYPTLSNGVPKAFEVQIQNTLAGFVTDLDVNKAANALTNYTRETANGFTITWTLV